MKKIMMGFFLSLGILILLAVIIGFSFVTFSPQFGGKASEAQRQAYALTGHYADGIFLNDEEINLKLDLPTFSKMIRVVANPHKQLMPSQDIRVQKLPPQTLHTLADTAVRITWFGHSTFLIEIAGKKIMLDPIFSDYAAPHPWLGRKRFNSEPPITIEELSEIDAVIISHDHYDHLDYASIKQLKEKTQHFFVPLGVSNHLKRWGISDERISALDWWQEERFHELNIIFTPSRHMSGRGLGDQSATLWGSWIIQSLDKKIYFSGDGGYGKHFKAIGEKYGPFDLGLMECGQYNALWADVHMMPEQTVQASMDIGAELMIPIHWGAFALATHSWTDPIERVTRAAREQGVKMATPRIGESVWLGGSVMVPAEEWWAEEMKSKPD